MKIRGEVRMVAIEAGPLLASLIDFESAAAQAPSGPSACLPLVLCLLGILLTYFLSLPGE
jgi:hypothetical protein